MLEPGKTRLGILGGGQLGKMLIQKAADWDIHVSVLDPDPNAPCRHLCHYFETGSFDSHETVLAFGRNVDVLTIEIEHVNVAALEQLEKEGKAVFPQAQVIKTIQDKGLQKLFFEAHKIPSAPFFLTDSKIGLKAKNPAFPFVQKLRKLGYDGRGVAIIKSEKDLEKTFDAPTVVEEKVDIIKEISVLVSRNAKGETATFPAVELQYVPEANLVDYLISPASISAVQAEEASGLALKVINALGMVGILAVEMFLTKDHKILVNEIAPRPHNSGHQTIEGNKTSQYEQHLRAIFSFPPGPTEVIFPSVMINVLGEPGFDGPVLYQGFSEVLKIPGAFIHLYGKTKTRAYRKMGHCTLLGETLEEAMMKAAKVRSHLKVVSQ